MKTIISIHFRRSNECRTISSQIKNRTEENEMCFCRETLRISYNEHVSNGEDFEK